MYVESQSANWLNYSPVPMTSRRLSSTARPTRRSTTRTSKVNLRRGVYRQNYFFWGLPADGTLYACTPTDERCLQETLPPLSATNTVPWTISF